MMRVDHQKSQLGTDKRARFQSCLQELQATLRRSLGGRDLEHWFPLVTLSIGSYFESLLDDLEISEKQEADARSTCNRLKNQLEQASDRAKDGEGARARVAELEADLAALQHKSAQLLEVTAGRGEALLNNADEIQVLRAENQSLVEEATLLRAVPQTLSPPSSAIQDLFLARQQLQHTRDELRQAVADKQRAEHELLTMRGLEVELTIFRNERARQEAEHDSEREKLRSRVEAIEDSRIGSASEFRAVISALELANEELQFSLQTAELKVDHLEAERLRVQAEFQLAERDLADELTQVQRVHAEEISTLQSFLSKRGRELDETKVVLDAEAQTRKNLEGTVQQLRASLAGVREGAAPRSWRAPYLAMKGLIVSLPRARPPAE